MVFGDQLLERVKEVVRGTSMVWGRKERRCLGLAMVGWCRGGDRVRNGDRG